MTELTFLMFENFDFDGFWEKSDYAAKEYVDDPLTPEKLRSAEERLGFKLPAAYVEFMRYQNGGIPKKSCHRTSEPTSWADDHVALTGIYSIGNARSCSLCGTFSSQFWSDEWGYPPIGVYFADCPSAGHEMFCLDYRQCGPRGEPRVVHVDQERDYKVTDLAPDFESFVRGLQSDDEFEPEG